MTTVTTRTPEQTMELGRRIGQWVRAGDVLVLTGDLGAGKTTFTRGLGEGLGVEGAVTSPTFVLSRVHPSATGGPGLVHVDAYRLESRGEVDDIDLETDLARAVLVAEWGAGLVEQLTDRWIELELRRSSTVDEAPDESGPREIQLAAVGEWEADRERLGALRELLRGELP
ncbi:tRNA threonylcarbamoyladenosine biosynthesis protein TsaE [Kytococcus aerolatus]|uniref:tRNA threonylcarbamoyladenosine biosynthesis protein TsaE n=1 Tax=Kytococcus aerolatus TaxID=592308 RepID=A0A212TZ41_9MICO|nr:tRNA (adenosine(37)-N6)-threonylcarbamoyltransferase complex ATPase subunit type 1 TsaE [Kytococcus aerolatus]SNC71277.1 tRNA threonylcarbamoyladenosine biosynthesis protein TsaE [Kytococcus aerolatus]